MGRSARSSAGVQFRQPLPEIIVRVAADSEVSVPRRMGGLLKEELNVKAVSLLEPDSGFIDYSLRPSLPVVGRRLGRSVKEFTQSLAGLDARRVAENVRRGLPTEVVLGGEAVEFEPPALIVDVKSPRGYAAVEEGG